LPDAPPFGFLNIDKPLGPTSHAVVGRVRRIFGLRRVGHAGTLDPLATGVLVVCVGTATRLSEYAMASVKAYRARVQLGATTTTYDAEGDITSQAGASHITQPMIAAVLAQFTGQIEQLPPMYSAIKQDGKKLYELAREGKTVERQPRSVRIDALTVTDFDPVTAQFTLEVTCGSGTYIRSLAYDIGEALGVGGHLVGLVRTKSGNFDIADAVTLETLAATATPSDHLMSVRAALAGFPSIMLTPQSLVDVQHGRWIDGAAAVENGTLALSYAPDGKFIAIVQAVDGRWKPHKVFSSMS
jgi:tRNA pseudouridine55 synthase